jgi:DnaJ-domain-containing protein 1
MKDEFRVPSQCEFILHPSSLPLRYDLLIVIQFVGRLAVLFRPLSGGSRLLAPSRDSYVSVGANGVRCRQTPLGGLNEPSEVRVDTLPDVSPDDVLAELRRTQRRIQVAPFAQVLGLPGAAGALYLALVERAPALGIVFALVSAGGVLACYLFLRELDKRRCTSKLVFEMDEDVARRFLELRHGFSRFASCRGVWFVPHGSRHPERAKEIGATAPLHRYRVRPELSTPPRVHSNLKVPTLHAGRLSFYFFPDRVYVYGVRKISTIAYEEIVPQAIRHHYMEDDEVPSDACIAGSTWRYVHPDGTKDLHYHNNYQVPIVIYGEMRLTGPKSLDALYQCSQPDAAPLFASALAGMSAVGEERHAARVEEEEAEEAASAAESDEPEIESGERDPRFDEALAVAVSAGYASSSLLATRMQMKFERATSIVEMMEDEGYVEPARGTEPRLVKQSARRCVELLDRLSGSSSEEHKTRNDSSRARAGRTSGWRPVGRATRGKGKTAEDVLGVVLDATPEEVAAAYHQLAQLYHPDKVANLAPEFMVIAERRMREINAAYHELTRRAKA